LPIEDDLSRKQLDEMPIKASFDVGLAPPECIILQLLGQSLTEL
jgi:hypothetical protein